MTQTSLRVLKRRLQTRARKETSGPKYQRVLDALTEAIHSGELQPGARIPAESALCEQLSVSLGTVQKALGKLADNGLVVRNRRTGTFVADRSSQASEAWVFRFRDPRTGELQLPFVRVLKVEQDSSRGPWRELLGGQACVRVDRLLWIENDPPAFTSVYVALEHGRTLLKVPIEELHGSSVHRRMVEQFNLPTLRVEHRIGCRKLSADACEWLRVARGSLGTVWDVHDFSIADRPILFQRLQLPPEHRPLEIAESLLPAASRSTRRRIS
ncbi:MAG TPA: GntR family transcriptional regulator [Steroidobacteraceae bacterium]|nr:GntR family transcriptional regulator [Steroidobacteraceae bacterium]